MSNDATQLITGRIVSGNPSMLTGATDMKTRAPILDKDGSQKQIYWTTLAVGKNNPELGPFFQVVLDVAKRQWPAILNDDNKLFAWKIMDGDGFRSNGKPYVDYCRGCWLITVRSSWLPSLVEPDGRNGWVEIVDPSRLKVGYHVKMGLKVNHNGDSVNPGLYMNPDYLALIKTDTVLSPRQISLEEMSNGLGQSGPAIQHPMYSSPSAPVAPKTHEPAPEKPQNTNTEKEKAKNKEQ